MFRAPSLALLAALTATTVAMPARADDAADFMARFSGEWLGSGKLLFGAENGMEFACELNGNPSKTQLTFGMKGKCWMGRLSAPIHARLRYNADTNAFYGEFMDGADGSGVDIMGARAGEGFSLKLTRGSAQGRLAAETVDADQMKVTIFFRDRANNRELPVVAMGFTRKEGRVELEAR
jgi:hypothetical protein